MGTENKKKVLVVEDEATLQKTLSEVLVQEGYEVFSSFDGESGLNVAIEKKPDLILLDIILPKMDGFEVLRRLKKNEETSIIPVMILTNLSDMSDIQKALDIGATTYLIKADFHLGDVLEKVKNIIEK